MSNESTTGPTSRAPLRRFGSLLLIERALVWRALVFQVLQSVTYLPFFAALGILIDRVLQNRALSPSQKVWVIGGYALANLLLWPLHG